MLARLAESIEYYRPQRRGNREVAAVEELLRVAKQKARATGKSLGQVLRDHREALQEGRTRSKFILSTSNSHSIPKSNENVRQAMEEQDARRAEQRLNPGLRYVAEQVEREEASRMIVPHPTRQVGPNNVIIERPELAIPDHVSTSASVTRRPARSYGRSQEAHHSDHLRLMAPPSSDHHGPPLRLTHNRALDGVGIQNAIDID
tara:strand:- start:1382 stop:1993 length:612 start_codon:yes stop_codon:yes gene_type:complete